MIKAIRQSKKMTLQAFAEASGQKNKQEGWGLENGKIPIGLNRFCDICRNLKIEEPKIQVHI